MIEKLNITNFKSIVKAELDVNQLSIITGENSSGKSTALQAYLLAHWQILSNETKEYIQKYCSNPINVNAQSGANAICQINDNPTLEISSKKDNIFSFSMKNTLIEDEPQRIRFLSADRIGPQEVYSYPSDDSLGIHGQFAPSFFEINKFKELNETLCVDLKYPTLGAQVNYWLREIIETEIKTEKIANLILLKFKNSDEVEFLALNTGFGSSVVFPIVVACLASNIGDTVVIENPEIHLHPKAQAKLADFFAFIANAGVRVILETHCEHLIYKLCYNVYKEEISNENVTIYYKEKDNSLENNGYKKINISKGGRFLDVNGEPCKFPSGFFDATAKQYLELF